MRQRLSSIGLLASLLLSGLSPLTAQDHLSELRALQPRIDTAIDKGVQWLLKEQLPDGSWPFMEDLFPNGQTAISVYTLLKCGLGPDHPAVNRGLGYLKKHPPTRVYPLALQMMAYQATKQASYKPLIKELMGKLTKWASPKGLYGYPGAPNATSGGKIDSWEDLSNAQYAALGLRAAMLAGLRVSPKLLQRLLTRTMKYQESQVRVKLPKDPIPVKKDGYARSPEGSGGTGYAAGFFYHLGGAGHGRTVTGSMTTAGLGIALIVRDCLGKKISSSVDKKIRRITTAGLNWLRKNWTVTTNPHVAGKGPMPGGPANQWHYYYLYGLERIGSLLTEEILAGHAWYLEGARVLVDQQGNAGQWDMGDTKVEPDTCFALLFLKRATWSGGTTGKPAPGAKGNENEFTSDEGEIELRGQGLPDIALWIQGIDSKSLAKWKTGSSRTPELRVVKVDYYVNGELRKSVDADPSRRWKNESFATKIKLGKPETYSLTAHLHALPPGTKGRGADTELVVLKSDVMKVEVKPSKEPERSWLDDALDGNLITSSVTLKSSSERSPSEAGGNAVDGKEASRWVTKPDDTKPRLTIKSRSAMAAQHIVITQTKPKHQQVGGAPGNPALLGIVTLITKVEIRINGSKKATAVAEVIKGTGSFEIKLEKPMKIKQLDIRVVGSEKKRHAVAISEVYVY